MKKRLMMLLALALAAAMLSGCSIDETFDTFRMIRLAKQPEEPTPLPTAMLTVDGLYAYEQNAMYEASEAYIDEGFFPYEFNTEEYDALTENGFRSVITSPLSTFSADVDTASYCNLRRMLNDDYYAGKIPSGAVRIEEMLNYFRYDYRQPSGDDRFAVTAQLAPCPWNEKSVLLMLGVQAEKPVVEENGSNLVFLVDVSGSMYGSDKIDLVKQSLIELTDELTERDTLSIVTYASGEDIIIEGANPKKDRAKLLAAIDTLYPDGSTNGHKGLQQAYEIAQKYFRPNGNNRIIMCSDGDLNVGITSTSDLHDYVSEKRDTGIYLSVLGFGYGNYKDNKMETLADNGNGNYYYIDSILEARKVLLEDMSQTLYSIADDVKFQIEFNPGKVASYRQVGYENRALENEDFENDEKDAGEVGAGASVTVMYELILADSDTGDGASSLRYQSGALTEAAQGDEWMTVSIRYKNPGESDSRLIEIPVTDADYTDSPDSDFLFASAVAEFGMILKESEYIGSANYESVLNLLKQADLNDTYKEEFFSLVKIAQRASQLQ